ncbi:MAG: hypothetical protein ACLR4O_15095 [Lachnospiraceae bacterium]
METEVKTIQEMADELGITYDSLRKQLQREPLRSWMAPFWVMKGCNKCITSEGEKVIRWQYPETEIVDQKMEALLMEKDGQIKDLIEMIRQEIEEKNSRIRQLEQELEVKDMQIVQLEQSQKQKDQQIQQLEYACCQKLKQAAKEEPQTNHTFAWQKR